MARPRGTNVTKTRLFLGNAELAEAQRLAPAAKLTISRYTTEALRRYNAAMRRRGRPAVAPGAQDRAA